MQESFIVKAENLQKRVLSPNGSLEILSGVDFALKAGEAVSILGASGSGKSTLLGLLAGLDLPSGGEIHLLGQSIGQYSEDQRSSLRAGEVGFVFQSFQLLAGMTALENVMLPLELAQLDAPEQAAEQLLAQVGLAQRSRHYPNQLSGGEQQRVALARAFAGSPRVLFADEPTGNLDAQTGELIIEQLFFLRESNGTALLLVTHDEKLAARCDRVLRLESGCLQEVA